MSGEKNKNIIVILAGGLGERYDAAKPKQYAQINGKELVAYSIEEMKMSMKADLILVVLNNDKEEQQRVRDNYHVQVIDGGER